MGAATESMTQCIYNMYNDNGMFKEWRLNTFMILFISVKRRQIINKLLMERILFLFAFLIRV